MPQKIFLIILLFISFYYNNQQVFAACRSGDTACEKRARLSAENDREIAERDRIADTKAAGGNEVSNNGGTKEINLSSSEMRSLQEIKSSMSIGESKQMPDGITLTKNENGEILMSKGDKSVILDIPDNSSGESKDAPKSESNGGDTKKSGDLDSKTSTTNGTNNTKITSDDYQKGIDAAQKVYDEAKKTYEIKALDGFADISKEKEAMDNAKKGLDNYKDAYANQLKKEAQAKEAARDAECEASQTCFDKPNFVIDTNTFSIGGTGLKQYDSKSTINNTLGTIIQKMMIALGVIALFVMTVGAGYMIMYRGHDEYLSKGKNIFIGGVTALIVALSSYYIVNIIGYVLYK